MAMVANMLEVQEQSLAEHHKTKALPLKNGLLFVLIETDLL